MCVWHDDAGGATSFGVAFPSLSSTQNVCLSRIFFISLRFKVQDSDDLML